MSDGMSSVCSSAFLLPLARACVPERRIGEQVGALGYVGPGPHPRDPVRERLDIALDMVEPRHLLGEPALRDAAVAFAQMAVEPRDQPGVMIRAGLAEVGEAAGGPEAAHPIGSGRAPAHFVLLGAALQHGPADAFRRPP